MKIAAVAGRWVSTVRESMGQLTPQLALHYTVYSIWEMKAWCEFTHSMLAQKLFLEKAVFRQKVK